MADTITLNVTGLDTLQKSIEALPRYLQQRVLGDAMSRGGIVLRDGIADKIHSRTGKTAHDLRVEVHLDPAKFAGITKIGGSTEKGGRAYVLNFLERGTKPHRQPKLVKAPSSPRRSI